MGRRRQLCRYLRKISLQSDQDQNIIGAKNQIISPIDEKWPTEDRHDTNRLRKAEITNLLPDSRRSLWQGKAFKGGRSTAQLSLKSKEIFLHRLEFQSPHLAIDGEECLLELADSSGCPNKQLVQLRREGGLVARQQSTSPQDRDLATKVCMRRIDLRDSYRGLAMEPEHLDFSVYSFGNGNNSFIDGLSRNRDFFLEPWEEFQEHRGPDGTSDKSYYVNFSPHTLLESYPGRTPRSMANCSSLSVSQQP